MSSSWVVTRPAPSQAKIVMRLRPGLSGIEADHGEVPTAAPLCPVAALDQVTVTPLPSEAVPVTVSGDIAGPGGVTLSAGGPRSTTMALKSGMFCPPGIVRTAAFPA